MTGYSHAFVIPAYGRSPHLRDCLLSLQQQKNFIARIVVSTSTPYEGLRSLCDEMRVSLFVHAPNKNIAHDWNTALQVDDAEWVTIAHQDDVYLPDFVEQTLKAASLDRKVALVFTGYREFDEGQVRPMSGGLLIKALLIELAFLGRDVISGRLAKNNLLRFGCPIPCPSVTLRRNRIPEGMRFDERYRVNLDWDFWLRLAEVENFGFACVRRPLMLHRIHECSETSAGIADGTRAKEDLELFSRLWPDVLASAIARVYSRAYAYNDT